METDQLYGHWIDGKRLPSVSGATFDSISPVTGEVVAKVALAAPADVDLAVQAARRAAPGWGSLAASDRGELISALADAVKAAGKELAAFDAAETGRPILDCEEDIPAAVSILRYFGGAADKLQGATMPVQPGYHARTVYEPFGVVAAIVPWNYPIYNACVKIGPALAAGNTCVLKPAEEGSLSALLLGELASQCGFPEGVLNVVAGPGEVSGAALAHHMDVDKLSFTGSTETGRHIMEAAARSNLKHLTLELGGKSPAIVFDDANLDAAANSLAFSVFFNLGQTCTAATRLLVQDSVAEAFVERLVAKARSIRVGDPQDEATQVGAIVSNAQYQRVLAYLDDAKASQATIECGGGAVRVPGLEKGLFVAPTIISNVTSDMKFGREEIFGPVLSVMRFSDEDEAVALANDTQYGLAASIWTRDASRLARLSSRVEAGIIWGNCAFVENAGVPVGGYGQSGWGREYGLDAMREYSRLKTVWTDFTDTAFEWVV